MPGASVPRPWSPGIAGRVAEADEDHAAAGGANAVSELPTVTTSSRWSDASRRNSRMPGAGVGLLRVRTICQRWAVSRRSGDDVEHVEGLLAASD
jgi:hypothetical protein